jgi:hypothetical protein
VGYGFHATPAFRRGSRINRLLAPYGP